MNRECTDCTDGQNAGGIRGRCANHLSPASGGWHSRLSTSRSFIREIRVTRGLKNLPSSALFFQVAVQRDAEEGEG